MVYASGISVNFHWIFYKVLTNKYIITNEEELKEGGLADLLDDGYEIIWDSALSKEKAKEPVHEQINSFLDWYQKDYPLDTFMLEQPKPLKLETVPLTLKSACEFVNQYHRHHIAPQGHKFSIGISDGDTIVRAVIAGQPISRHNNDSKTLEITRCCMKSSIYKNGVTKLFSAVYQVAKAMGYNKLISYTLLEESGISLKACGFELDGISEGGSWSSKTRIRVDKAPTGKKKRWVKKIF